MQTTGSKRTLDQNEIKSYSCDMVTMAPFDNITKCIRILILPVKGGNATSKSLIKNIYRPMKVGDTFIDLSSNDSTEYIIMYMSPCKYGIVGPSTEVYTNIDEFTLNCIFPLWADTNYRFELTRITCQIGRRVHVDIVVPSGPNKGIQKLIVELPVGYPFKPPKFRFISNVIHPRVDHEGVICLFDCNEGPMVTIPSLLLDIVSVLTDSKDYHKSLKSIDMHSNVTALQATSFLMQSNDLDKSGKEFGKSNTSSAFDIDAVIRACFDDDTFFESFYQSLFKPVLVADENSISVILAKRMKLLPLYESDDDDSAPTK